MFRTDCEQSIKSLCRLATAELADAVKRRSALDEDILSLRRQTSPSALEQQQQRQDCAENRNVPAINTLTASQNAMPTTSWSTLSTAVSVPVVCRSHNFDPRRCRIASKSADRCASTRFRIKHTLSLCRWSIHFTQHGKAVSIDVEREMKHQTAYHYTVSK